MVPSGRGLACGLQDQRLMARPPARAGGRSGLLTGGESGNPNGYSLPFSQRVPSHIPSPPSRWAGRYGPFAVRAAGRVSCKKYGLPPHNPTREGSPEGRTSSLWGSFPHFFPRNGAPAGQAKVPCRSNGAGGKPTTASPGKPAAKTKPPVQESKPTQGVSSSQRSEGPAPPPRACPCSPHAQRRRPAHTAHGEAAGQSPGPRFG